MQESFDVIVVGSGGAGLIGALVAARGGKRVLVLERAALIGGSTAVSGGYVWAPNHHLLAEAGITDSREDALAYCRATTAGGPLIETFVDTILGRATPTSNGPGTAASSRRGSTPHPPPSPWRRR